LHRQTPVQLVKAFVKQSVTIYLISNELQMKIKITYTVTLIQIHADKQTRNIQITPVTNAAKNINTTAKKKTQGFTTQHLVREK